MASNKICSCIINLTLLVELLLSLVVTLYWLVSNNSYLSNCYKVRFMSRENSRHFIFRALERPQGAREIKFREFSSDIKGLLAVGYVVLSHEAG